MNETWPESVDLVVAGTGVAALSAAITAADAGLSVLMLESTDRWGGSSAMSGGGLWLPKNPLMRREGAADSRDEALTYLERTVGDAGPATSRERKEALVDGVDGFVGLAERHGVRFARSADYPDYYPELPGGKIGRAIEVEPFDVRTIGEWWQSSRGQDGVPAPVKTDDFWLLSRAWSTPGGFVRGARVVFRTLARPRGANRRSAWVRPSPHRCSTWPFASVCRCGCRRRSKSSCSTATGWWACAPPATAPSD